MFGSLIACYLFLGGAGAGACLASATLGLLSPADLITQRSLGRKGAPRRLVYLPDAYGRLLVPGLAAGALALGAGAVCLLADVGRIDRVELLLLNPSLSYVAVGTWALVICSALAACLLAAWVGLVRLPLATVRVVEVLLFLTSIAVMAYTGLLLQSMLSVPLWSTFLLPALFVLSSLSCGCALVLAAGQFSMATRSFDKVFRRLAAVDAVVIVCEIVIAAWYVAAVSNGEVFGAPAFPEASATGRALDLSAWQLVGGPDAWLFWGVFWMGGLVVPLVFDVVLARRSQPAPMFGLVVAGGLLAGGFALRYCVVEAGMQPVLQALV